MMLTSEEIVGRLAKKNMRLLSPYTGTKFVHRLKCLACGNKWKATLMNGGQGCPQCGRERARLSSLLSISDIRKRLKMVRIRLLDEYKGVERKHKLKCLRCNHTWVAKNIISQVTLGCGCPSCWTDVLQEKRPPSPPKEKHVFRSGCSCSKCSLQEKDTRVRSRLKKYGIDLVGEYLGVKVEHTLCCIRCKHEWKGKWYIKVCPKCERTVSVSEAETIRVLEKLTGKKFKKVRPSWTRGYGRVLELDGYNKELGLACEYQGQQHYKLTNFGGKGKDTQEKLRTRQLNDERKRFLCRYHGVFLIRVPYWIKDIHSFLRKKLLRYCAATRRTFPGLTSS